MGSLEAYFSGDQISIFVHFGSKIGIFRYVEFGTTLDSH